MMYMVEWESRIYDFAKKWDSESRQFDSKEEAIAFIEKLLYSEIACERVRKVRLWRMSYIPFTASVKVSINEE